MLNEQQLERRIQRERAARKTAEQLLEEKSLELYHRNRELEALSETLEQKIGQRTQALKIARDEAQAANNAKGAFLTNVSHEIRTPLTAIIGFAENIANNITPPEQQKKALRSIVNNGKHLLALINDVLDVSHIESQRLNLEPVAFSLDDLFEEVRSNVSRAAHEKGLKFILEFAEDTPRRIINDPTRLRQIMFNLGGNAVKFTEEGEIAVRINYETERNLLHVNVSDTGIGIEQTKLARLFQPFSQADHSISRRHGGTGMGLYISSKLALQMGGSLNASSRPGHGSVFELKIDCGDWQSIPDSGDHDHNYAGSAIKAPALRGKILVAEDVPANQDLISEILHATGAKYCIVNNGRKAVSEALSNDYDLILMDIQMPTMDGKQAVKMLRSLSYDKPIVALTANVMAEEIREYQELGFTDQLSKPIQLNNFLAMLGTHLESVGDTREEEIISDPDFLDIQEQVKQIFLEHLPRQISQLRQAIENRDPDNCFTVVHTLKGSAGSVGFQQITDIAAELQIAVKSSPLPELENRLLDFCDDLQALLDHN